MTNLYRQISNHRNFFWLHPKVFFGLLYKQQAQSPMKKHLTTQMAQGTVLWSNLAFSPWKKAAPLGLKNSTNPKLGPDATLQHRI